MWEVLTVSSKDAILVFSKSAETGNVKTRMRPLLSDQQCLSLHLALLQDTITKIRKLVADPYLFLAGSTPLPFDPGIPICRQRGGDLGERMQTAFSEVLMTYNRVVITGTDSPAFPPHLFQQAFDGLETHDLVVGPAEDGGYYLIGLRKVLPEVFTGIDWGSSAVLQQTLVKLGHRTALLLEKQYDVDEPEDLIRLQQDAASSNAPYLHHTREWLAVNYSAR